MLCGCVTDVELRLVNSTKLPQEPVIEIKDKRGTPEGDVFPGIIEPGEDKDASFKVENGGSFEVVSRLVGSAETGREKVTVTGNPDPLVKEARLQQSGVRLIDDKSAAENLGRAFGDLGPNVGFKPLLLSNALETVYGALIVLTPAGSDGEKSVVHFHLKPGLFAPRIADAQFRYPENDKSDTVEITASNTAGISATYLFGSLNLDSSSQDAYRLHYEMKGFGQVQRADGEFNYIQAIQNLKLPVKKAIAKAIDENPGSYLLYVDKMYVIQSARFEVTRGQKLGVGAKLGAAEVVSASGAWTFDQSNAKIEKYDNSVVNISGIRMSAIKIDQSKVETDPLARWVDPIAIDIVEEPGVQGVGGELIFPK